jgi:hypothetical protein
MKIILLVLLTLYCSDLYAQDASNRILQVNEHFWSPKRHYFLIFQGDGNLVYYKANGEYVWQTATNIQHADKCEMQFDGNLVIYKGTTALWNSHTMGHTGQHSYLSPQDDGNLVIYACINCHNVPLWSRLYGEMTLEQINDYYPKTNPNAMRCCPPYGPPPPPPNLCNGNGIINFHNNTASQVFNLYYFIIEDIPRGSNECFVRKPLFTLNPGETKGFQIPRNKTIAYRVYTNDNCDSGIYFWGDLYYCSARGGTIEVPN